MHCIMIVILGSSVKMSEIFDPPNNFHTWLHLGIDGTFYKHYCLALITLFLFATCKLQRSSIQV